LAYMEVGTVTVSPLPLGRGWTDSAHGRLPLPAPATLALLNGVPIHYEEVEAELVTPTGAALLTSIADHFGGFPPMTLRKVGCGAGRRDLPFPNVIRLWLGDADTNGGMLVEQLTLLETNIDDMNPQIYAHVMEQLFSAGALDVTLTPTQMKKNRPGCEATDGGADQPAADVRDGTNPLWPNPGQGGNLAFWPTSHARV
jgi:uncharacterized protein (DUF111 family)